MDKVIIVSADGHAVMEPELWPKYLEREYHEHLPAFEHEREVFTDVDDAPQRPDAVGGGVRGLRRRARVPVGSVARTLGH